VAANPRVQYIVQQAQRLGLDPAAVLAIASHEGLSGGIGDGGHAFGPFQENNAGGVLTGRMSNLTPQQLNAWAWSNAGINDALGRINSVAHGLKGNAAIQAITTRFERPANPAAEIADAEAHYGAYSGGRTGATQAPQGSVSPPNATGASVNAGGSMSRRQLANLIFGGANRVDFNSGQINVPNLMVLAQARQQLAQSQPSTASRTKAAALVGGGGKMVPNPTGSSIPFIGDTAGVNPGLLAHVSAAAKAAGATQIRVTSGFRSPEHNAAVGGVSDSNHTTGHALDGEAYIPGRGWLPLGQVLLPVAGKFGLRSGDVPGFFNGNPDPVHVDDGWNVTH